MTKFSERKCTLRSKKTASVESTGKCNTMQLVYITFFTAVLSFNAFLGLALFFFCNPIRLIVFRVKCVGNECLSFLSCNTCHLTCDFCRLTLFPTIVFSS